LQYGIFIDDLDFVNLDLSDAPNYAINLKAEAGVWVETADKKYKAYIFINSVNNGSKSAVISIKRYTM
jgi:predicted nucleic acid-binding protein